MNSFSAPSRLKKLPKFWWTNKPFSKVTSANDQGLLKAIAGLFARNFVSFISFDILTESTNISNIMISILKKPTVNEQKTAQRSVSSLKQLMAVSTSEGIVTFQVKGESFEVPRKAALILERVLEEMALGNSVEVTSIESELTTQQAADLLNVSRPHLIKLLETGKIPFKKVGTHRKVTLRDVQKYDFDLRE